MDEIAKLHEDNCEKVYAIYRQKCSKKRNTNHLKHIKEFLIKSMIPIGLTFRHELRCLAQEHYMLMFEEIFTESQMPLIMHWLNVSRLFILP